MISLKQGLHFAQQKLNSLERKHTLLKFDVNDVCTDFSINAARIKVLNSRVNTAYREEEKKWNRCLANAVRRADSFQIKNKELLDTIQELETKLSIKEDEYRESVSETEILRQTLGNLQMKSTASNDQNGCVRRNSVTTLENMTLDKGLLYDIGVLIQEDMKVCIHELNDLTDHYRRIVNDSCPLEGTNTSEDNTRISPEEMKVNDFENSQERRSVHQTCLYFTDIKGDMQRFKRTVAACRCLRFEGNGEMTRLVLDDNVHLVYGGNVFDVEMKDVEFSRIMVSTKRRYPNQVHLLLGQNEFKLLKNQFDDSDERNFLLQDYFNFAQVGHCFGNVLFLNFPLLPRVAGKIPNRDLYLFNPQEWVRELNTWVNNEVLIIFERNKPIENRFSVIERLCSFLYPEGSTSSFTEGSFPQELHQIPRSTQFYLLKGGISTLIRASRSNIHFPWVPCQSVLRDICAPSIHGGTSRFGITIDSNGLPSLFGVTPDDKEFAFTIDFEGGGMDVDHDIGEQLADGRCVFAKDYMKNGKQRFLVTNIPSEQNLRNNHLPETDVLEAGILIKFNEEQSCQKPEVQSETSQLEVRFPLKMI
eukprot:140361-Hanusia_phi.AAC.2